MASSSSRKLALLTGWGGFTAGHLAGRLEAAGYTVVGLRRKNPRAEANVVAADLTDSAATLAAVQAVKPEVVVHLAGISFVGHGDAAALYASNLIAPRNLLEALSKLAQPPRAVLLASSANIYGNSAEPLLHEDVAPAPTNDYAVSKLAMEHMARLWMDRLPITLVRPFNYTGPGQSPRFVIPKIVGHFQRAEPEIRLGNLDVFREYVDVRTVAEAYTRLLDAGAAGQTVNVCTGCCHSLAEVLDLLADIAGRAIPVCVDPDLVRRNEVRRLVGSPARLHSLVGPLPSIPLQDTLRWMFESS